MEAKGTITSIVYRNVENGYTVLTLKALDGETYTCVGCLPIISEGEVLSVWGSISFHNKYGEQIDISEYKVSDPTNREGIIKYLSSGLIRGIGEVTAKNIYEYLGDDALSVIENNPSALVNVKGISQKKAMDVSNAVAELKRMQKQIMFLQQFDVTTNLAIKIYNCYKEKTQAVLMENPYRLISDVDGIGFVTADKIALSMGHARDGEFRVKSALVYRLKESAEKEGNTYLEKSDLFARAEEILGLSYQDNAKLFEDSLTKLILEPVVKEVNVFGKKGIALKSFYYVENFVATMLLTLNRDASRHMLAVDDIVKHFEQTNGISFHPSQISAIRSAVVNGVTVITGGPGTGKTTIIKCIAEIFSSASMRVEFCAPTGRASKRLAQSTGKDAKTIHRLLGYEFSDGKMHFKYNSANPLQCDVVIVDEVSMVDVNLMYNLLSALKGGTRLVLVGDKDQLPSVGAGNVLADVIGSGVVEVKYLTYVYRQSEDSLIVSNAHLINQCKMPEINNHSKDFFFSESNDLKLTAQTAVGLVADRLPGYCGVSSKEIQVLAALKKGEAGVESLNEKLQERLNPRKFGKGEILYGKTVFREGDRVMQTVNNYDLQYERRLPNGKLEKGSGVFNGDIGFITGVNKNADYLEVLFDDGRDVVYTMADICDLQLAYAVTVHKSQGSEFDVVVLVLLNGQPTLINKNLLYTAITRAKKTVVLVGSKKVLAMMVHNNYVATRTTLLEKFLKEQKTAHERFFSDGKGKADTGSDVVEQADDCDDED